jgi:hypothetical protein
LWGSVSEEAQLSAFTGERGEFLAPPTKAKQKVAEEQEVHFIHIIAHDGEADLHKAGGDKLPLHTMEKQISTKQEGSPS